ncbi:MAG: capsule biosynthesis protein [Rhodobacteraceae bacterium]|nr:capsule biosynthesis protein [Paracoccaceae bacterium]
MTTTPKAHKFQLGPEAPKGAGAAADQAKGPKPAAKAPGIDTGLDTGNSAELLARAATDSGETQATLLRRARRLATHYGLPFDTDDEAVDILRQHNIDPFQMPAMMHRAALSEQTQPARREKPLQAPPSSPQTNLREDAPKPPNISLSPHQKSPAGTPHAFPNAAQRSEEISALQNSMTRRRRRLIQKLILRLSIFILLPTLAAGYYYSFIATPMYATDTAFQITTGDSTNPSSPSMFGGGQFATTPDAIAVQTYLQSKEAMIRLQDNEGFKATFSDPTIDWWQRLPTEASFEETYKTYLKHIKIAFDPTEGMINMEISSPSPELSVLFSKALLTYAEQKIDGLSQRKQENQLSDARKSLATAEDARVDAQRHLIALQQSTLLDPEAYATSLRAQISGLEEKALQKTIELQAFLDNANPNSSRVAGLRAEIQRLQNAKRETEAKMIAQMPNGMTLPELLARLQMAASDVATRDLMLQSALEQLRATQIQATSQSRYLTVAVEPIAPQDPAYPRHIHDTLLVFLILSGVYLIISITASILREQIL